MNMLLGFESKERMMKKILKRIYQWAFRKGRFGHKPYCPYRYEGLTCHCSSMERE